MNEEEFLKEHPSWIINGSYPWEKEGIMDRIHKTQIDKQKVKEIIDWSFEMGSLIERREIQEKLLKRLGLE